VRSWRRRPWPSLYAFRTSDFTRRPPLGSSANRGERKGQSLGAGIYLQAEMVDRLRRGGLVEFVG
jgi:hypothetical protein